MERRSKKKIIFVCTGNTCRSPMAEAVLKAELKRIGCTEFVVASAGLKPEKNGALNALSARVLREYGYAFSEKFRPKRLTPAARESAWLIIAMTDSIRDRIGDGNVYSIRALSGYEIPDPFGKSIEHYRYCLDLLRLAMPEILKRILPRA